MGDFFEKYRRFAGGITDAPGVFHDYVARTVVGTALGNRVWIPFGDKEVRPNLWVLLLAPSSLYRKSTAIGIGSGLLEAAHSDALFPAHLSPRGVIFEMTDSKPSGLFVYPEWRARGRSIKLAGCRDDDPQLANLCDMLGFFRRITAWDRLDVRDSAISILCATSLLRFESSLTACDAEDGFLSRFLFVPARAKERTLVVPGEPDEELRAELHDEIRELAQVCGRATLSDDATARFEHWSGVFGEMTAKAKATPLAPFYARIQLTLLKLALIEQAVKEDVEEVSAESIDAGGKLCVDLAQNVKDLFGEGLATTRYERLRRKALALIEAKGTIGRRKLMRRLHVFGREFKTLIEDIVVEEGIVEMIEVESGKRKFWYSTPNRVRETRSDPECAPEGVTLSQGVTRRLVTP
jgi:hypothetical protein